MNSIANEPRHIKPMEDFMLTAHLRCRGQLAEKPFSLCLRVLVAACVLLGIIAQGVAQQLHHPKANPPAQVVKARKNPSPPAGANDKTQELGSIARKFYREHLAPQGEGGRSEPDAIRERFFTGAAAFDNFGHSVAPAGDVNGDGYSDVIAGAPYNGAGGTGVGQAYVYFGGASMDNTADVTLTGAAAGDYFGYSVAPAGDVNGDGYSDVIVG